jgi:hypothetical protein
MRVGSLLTATALAGTCWLAAPLPHATATSCAVPPGLTARALVTGTEPRRAGAAPYVADPSRFVLLGTVTGVRTDGEDSPTYGRTEVDVQVDAVLGTPPDQDDLGTVVLRQADPGWMNGYGFEMGGRYLVPVERESSSGVANFSFVCDPIRPLTGPAQVDRLVRAARAADVVPVTVPDAQPTRDPAESSDGSDETTADARAVATGTSGGPPPAVGTGDAATARRPLVVGGSAAVVGLVGFLVVRRRGRGYRHGHGPGPAHP